MFVWWCLTPHSTIFSYIVDVSFIGGSQRIKVIYVCLMVFNATFSNISVMSWRSVLLVEETGRSGENHRPVGSHDKLYHILLYTSP